MDALKFIVNLTSQPGSGKQSANSTLAILNDLPNIQVLMVPRRAPLAPHPKVTTTNRTWRDRKDPAQLPRGVARRGPRAATRPIAVTCH